MDIVITTLCNLKCTKCSNLMPLYNKDNSITYDIESLKTNSIKAIEKFKPPFVNILGGETFLHPNWKELVIYLQDYVDTFVYTNATILPNDLSGISDNVTFMIEAYPKSKYTKEIADLCEKYNVKYEVLTAPWIDYGDLSYYNLPRNNCFNACMTLMGDKLFICERAAQAHNLGIIESPYIDINTMSGSLGDFKSLEICKHCLIGTREYHEIERGDVNECVGLYDCKTVSIDR